MYPQFFSLIKVAVGYEKVEDEVGAISASDNDATPPVVFPAYPEDGAATAAAAWKANQDKFGYKASHISASFGLSSVTARVGFSVKDTNMTQVLVPDEDSDTAGAMEVLKSGTGEDEKDVVNKKKTTYLGFTGSIGDTGMDWRAFGRKVEGHNGKEMNPWAVGVGKALGGGAYTYIEHGNNDDGVDGTTKIALHIDF